MSKLPIGYTSASVHEEAKTTRTPWPQRIVICCPIAYGPPAAPARIVRCIECDAECWRSLRVTDEMPMVCDDCMDEHAPGWRDQHPPRISEATS